MAYLYLQIYDSGQWRGLDYFTDNIQVSSVSDMVTKVLDAMGSQQSGHSILLHGDGEANYQSVGAGSNRDSSGDRSLQVDGNGELIGAGKVWLPRLSRRISKIHLLGADDYGGRSFPLFLAVAKTLGIGCHVHGNHSLVVYMGENTTSTRQVQREVTLETGRLRDPAVLRKLDGK